MLSMTGYGKGEYAEGGIRLTAEVRSVNNRYLDVAVKAPKIFLSREDAVRALVRKKVGRGHVDVFVSLKDEREKPASFQPDLRVAAAYLQAVRALQTAFPETENDFTLTALLKVPDVLKQEESALDEELTAVLDKALSEALDALNRMRETEGKKLKADLLSRMDAIAGFVEQISARAPLVAETYRARLAERVQKALEGADVDEGRLLTEVAVFADKSNIDEELTRLRSHIAQFRSILREPVAGRKLDFLVQEFNRETNTVCSKSNDLTVTSLGLALKNEIEKIREQVQNLE